LNLEMSIFLMACPLHLGVTLRTMTRLFPDLGSLKPLTRISGRF
jgi:hypothetical protein